MHHVATNVHAPHVMRTTTPGAFRLTRRRLAAMTVGAVGASWCRATADQAGPVADVTVGVLVEPAATPSAESERLGVRFGLAEAAHVVTLIGSRLQVTEVTADTPDNLPGSATALIAAASGRVAMEAARLRPDMTVVTTCAATAPATRHCFSVASSVDVRDLARQQMSTGTQRVVDWDARLRRYGAAQLNERYQRHTNQPLDEHAWHGWMACKVVVELALRRATESTNVALVDLVFDGHKGRPLTFSSRHHHLVQPVYLIGTEMDATPVEVRPEDK